MKMAEISAQDSHPRRVWMGPMTSMWQIFRFFLIWTFPWLWSWIKKYQSPRLQFPILQNSRGNFSNNTLRNPTSPGKISHPHHPCAENDPPKKNPGFCGVVPMLSFHALAAFALARRMPGGPANETAGCSKTVEVQFHSWNTWKNLDIFWFIF